MISGQQQFGAVGAFAQCAVSLIPLHIVDPKPGRKFSENIRRTVPRLGSGANTCRKLRDQSDSRPGLEAKVCITTTKEAEAGGLSAQGLPGLLSEFKAYTGN